MGGPARPALLQHQIRCASGVLTKSKAADGRIEASRSARAHIVLVPASRQPDRSGHGKLLEADLEKITSTYHHLAGVNGAESYDDVPGFCKSATTARFAAHGHVSRRGSMGAGNVEDDGEPF